MPKRHGFSLVEILAVVLILGILAAVVAPKMFRTILGAKEVKLKRNLQVARQAIDMYQAEHGGMFPASTGDGMNAAGTEAAFMTQMAFYTNAAGVVSMTRTGEFCFGPYVEDSDAWIVLLGPRESMRRGVKVVGDGTSLSGESNPEYMYKYDYTTGEFIYNYNGLASDGVTRYDEF